MLIVTYLIIVVVLALLLILLVSKNARSSLAAHFKPMWDNKIKSWFKFNKKVNQSTEEMQPPSSKNQPKTGQPNKRKTGWFSLLLLILALLFLAGIVYWLAVIVMLGFRFTISLNGWWLPVSILVASIVIIDLLMGGENDEGNWKTRWKSWRGKFYFGLMWVIVVSLGNVILWAVKVEEWQLLWNYTPNHWFFYLVMTMVAVSMLLIVNQERGNIKLCGVLILVMALFGWGYLIPNRPAGPTEVIERISVEKGEIKQFRINTIKKVIDASGIRDDVDFKYRIDNREWKTHVAHTPWMFDQRDNRVEITPIDFDLVVLEKRIVRK